MYTQVTQVRYADGSTQWLRLKPEDAEHRHGVVELVSTTFSYNVTNWNRLPAPFSDEARNGQPYREPR